MSPGVIHLIVCAGGVTLRINIKTSIIGEHPETGNQNRSLAELRVSGVTGLFTERYTRHNLVVLGAERMEAVFLDKAHRSGFNQR